MASDVAARRPWLRFYDEGVPHTLTYPQIPLQGLLDDTAQRHPDRPATIYFNAVLTYRQLSELADRFAAALQADGLSKGDRVAIMLPNCPQYVIAFFGTLRAGGIVVPTNPLYTARELLQQLADSRAETLVVLSRMYPLAREVVAETALRRIVVANIKDHMPPVLRALFTLAKERKDGHRVSLKGDARAVRWNHFIRARGTPRLVHATPDDTAALLYTGGTTGVPKAAVLSHRALVANALQSRAWFTKLKEGEGTAMAVMPFFHSYGLTVVMDLAVLTASAMVLIPRFDLHDVLKNIQRHRPKMFAGAPRIYVAINNSPETKKYDLRSIEACISGSAALPIEVANTFERITEGGRVVEGYGLTEAAPVTHCNPLYGKRKVGSIGIPFPDVDAKIVDIETGTRDLPVGEAGEMVLRGPNLMDGYYGAPEETAQVLRDGWLFTGDIAKMDEEGYFSIVDRKKELIIVSGFNVYPRDVEEVLYQHSAVLEAAAIGIPHEEKGEVVKAFVALKPDQSATEAELIAHCATGLARYKVPVAIELRPELPKTLIGKVLRRVLAEEEKAKRATAL